MVQLACCRILALTLTLTTWVGTCTLGLIIQLITLTLDPKQEVLGSIPGGYPVFFFSFSWLILMQMDEGSVVL